MCDLFTQRRVALTHLPSVHVAPAPWQSKHSHISSQCACFTMSTTASSHSPLLCVTCQPWYLCLPPEPVALKTGIYSKHPFFCCAYTDDHHDNSGILFHCMWSVHRVNNGIHIPSFTVYVACSPWQLWYLHTSLFPVCSVFTMTTLLPYMHSFITCGNNDILQCV